jgi:hypothetical protein
MVPLDFLDSHVHFFATKDDSRLLSETAAASASPAQALYQNRDYSGALSLLSSDRWGTLCCQVLLGKEINETVALIGSESTDIHSRLVLLHHFLVHASKKDKAHWQDFIDFSHNHIALISVACPVLLNFIVVALLVCSKAKSRVREAVRV